MLRMLTRSDDNKENFFTTSMQFDITRADKDTKSIPVVISTETPVRSYMGEEILVHTTAAVNLERAKRKGLALLTRHFGETVGRVRNVRIKDRKLQGDMFFSRSELGQQHRQDVMDEIITDVSIGASRDKIQRNDDNIIEVLEWTPLEVSFEAVPGDPATGINRNLNHNEGDDMTEEEKKALRKKLKKEAEERANIRRSGIYGVFENYLTRAGVVEIRDTAVQTPETTVDVARQLLLDHLGKDQAPAQKDKAQGFEIGDTDGDKFRDGITRALSVRVGCATDDDKKDIGANPFTSFNPVDMARHFLQINNVSMVGMTRSAILGAAFVTRSIYGGNTSSDFPNILADVANKSMLIGYNGVPETWSAWTGTGNLADYKEAMRVALSAFEGLDKIPEGGEYKHGKYIDVAEKIRLLKYGKLFNISREALLNDDLSALGKIPQGMGAAAQRQVGDLPYQVLFDNPVMNQDDIVLFHADHNNLLDGGPPSVEAIDAHRVAMALQTDPSKKATLGVEPVYLLVPKEMEGLARTLVKAQYDPATDAGTLTPNAEEGRLTVVSDHRLSGNSAVEWYLAASPTATDTIEVAFLDGNSTPYIEQQEEFTRDGVTFKVRIEAGAAPLDFRGLSKDENTAMAKKKK